MNPTQQLLDELSVYERRLNAAQERIKELEDGRRADQATICADRAHIARLEAQLRGTFVESAT